MDCIAQSPGPKSQLVASLVALSDAYCAASGRSRASISKAIFGRGGQIAALESGERDLNTLSAEQALAWFSANWPEGADWPADVPRPQPAEAAE